MDTPIPQPYDITDIPHIAWVPGLVTWCGILLALGALALLVWRRNNPRHERAANQLFNAMVHELRAAASSEHVSVERISRTARRVGSHLTGINLTELTSDELRAYPPESIPPALREIMLAVAAVEDIGYAPPSPDRNAKARILIADLIERIIAYRSSRRPA